MPSWVIQPTWMKSAVIRPQAMKAPMFGMTMLDRNVPNFWTWTRAPLGAAVSAEVVAIESSDARLGCDPDHIVGQ